MQEAELLRRVAQLEKRYTQLRYVVIMLVTGLVLVTLVAAAPQKTLESTGFVLRDNAGKVRARLDLAPASQQPALIFYDQAGHETIDLGTSNDLAALVMYDHAGLNRVDLGLDPKGAPALVLSRVPPGHEAVVVARGDKRNVLRAP
jgi:hypothetical protein